MRILQICPRNPVPPKDGGAQGMFYIAESLRNLGNQVLTVAMVDGKIPVSKQHPSDFPLVLYPRPQSFFFVLRALLKGLPFSVAKYSTPDFSERVKSLIEDFNPDIVWFDHAHLGLIATSVRGKGNYRTLLRAHNLEWKIFDRSADASSNLIRRVLLRFEASRMKQFEADLPGKVDGVVCISELERDWFARASSATSSNASNLYLMPAGFSGKAPVLNSLPISQNVLHIAPLDWTPNADGLRWLLQEVWPAVQTRLPGAVLDIVGRNPPIELVRTFTNPTVQFHGFVDDIRIFEEKAQCLVVPLHVGGGIRIKLLNAFAQGIPVVTTSIGCEGLPIGHESHAFISDRPETFAASIIRCLENDPLVQPMRENAHHLVTREMSWAHLMKSLLDSLTQPSGLG